MTNEEINIVIAEHLGWQRYADAADGGECWHKTHEGYRKNPPNYAEDLNAMREAENTLDDDQWLEYMLNLQDVLQRDPNRGKWIVCQDNMHSTAALRAKAFVKTIGKRKE